MRWRLEKKANTKIRICMRWKIFLETHVIHLSKVTAIVELLVTQTDAVYK